MKKLQKMSLNVMKNNMNRNEMRVIKAGSGPGVCGCQSLHCTVKGYALAYCNPGGYLCC